MFSQLKQYKDLRDKAKVIQDALSKEFAEGSAGWGKVKITLNGNQKVTSVYIDPTLLIPTEKEKLEKLVEEAMNDALDKIQKVLATKMKDIGGLDLAKELQDMMGQGGGQQN